MDLATIEMGTEEAEAKFREYRDEVAGGQAVEGDVELMHGFDALARGNRLIRLADTIQRGGFTAVGLPNLAVARYGAATTWGWADRWTGREEGLQDGRVTFSPRENPHPNSGFASGLLSLEFAGLPTLGGGSGASRWSGWHAIVPTVPPALRPRRRVGISQFWILWEAEWRRKTPSAPRDPALIRRIRGDLWAVVAVWDLTELERAVLEQRQ